MQTEHLSHNIQFTGHLQTQGASIYSQLEGKVDAPTLLMLHGGMGSLEDFDPLVAALGQTFQLLRIDSRGHGRSTLGDSTLSYELLQRDVEAVVHKLGLSEVSIVGFSDGGIVGYRIAASDSITVRKLVTIGASWHLAESSVVYQRLASVTAQSWRQRFPDTVKRYEALNPNPEFERLVTQVTGMWTDLTDTGYPGTAIEHITCPVLAIRGDSDHLVSLEELLAFRSLVPGMHLLNVPFAGHETHKDQPEIVLAALRQFLLAQA